MSLATVVVLAVLAVVPASAAPPPKTTVTITPQAGRACAYIASITWKNVRGVARFYAQIGYFSAGVWVPVESVETSASGRSGSITTDGASVPVGTGTHDYSARGGLYDVNNQLIAGTQAVSATSYPETC